MILFLSMLDSDEEKSKFTRIYEKYRYFLWYLANEKLRDAHLAEDAVQDAFLALTRHLDKIGAVDSASTRNFLATIVKSKAIDIIRRKKGINEEVYDDSSVEEVSEDILDTYLVQENYERILDAIGRLDDIYRIVFEYKYLHGFSDREIAEMLDVTPKAVNVRIFRARKKLQVMLKEQEGCGR